LLAADLFPDHRRTSASVIIWPSCFKKARCEPKDADNSSSKETKKETVKQGLTLVQRSEVTKDDTEKSHPFTEGTSVEISTEA
jgi:hypothetical protein